MMDEADLLSIVNASGFPLQIAAEEFIRRTTQEHGWSVLSHEHPWTYAGQEGFVDIVLRHVGHPELRMVIECKRRQGVLLFLIPVAESDTERIRVRWAYREPQRKHPGGWVDVATKPASLESEFCVVKGEGGEKKASMLEGIAHEVVGATESMCREEQSLSEVDPMGSPLVYVPVILTTAKLAACRLAPSSVRLDDGKIEKATFEQVPFIRFRKALAGNPAGAPHHQNLSSSLDYSVRSVVVVTAEHLGEFLRGWDVKAYSTQQVPWKELRERINAEDREKWMQEQLEED